MKTSKKQTKFVSVWGENLKPKGLQSRGRAMLCHLLKVETPKRLAITKSSCK